MIKGNNKKRAICQTNNQGGKSNQTSASSTEDDEGEGDPRGGKRPYADRHLWHQQSIVSSHSRQ